MIKRRKNEDALILALACGATVEAAARQCHISERTIYRWLRDPLFQKRLAQVRADMVDRAAGVLTAASLEATKTLLELQRPGIPAPIRLGAAKAILELGLRYREIVDLETRIRQLEDQLHSRDSSSTIPRAA